MLRYFEADGTVRRALSVVKKRSGAHEYAIREFRLAKGGLQVGPAAQAVPRHIYGNADLRGRAETLDGRPRQWCRLLTSRTRVLVLAPTGRDAAAAVDQLGAAGLNALVCADVVDLIARLEEGAGAAVIAEEAFRNRVRKFDESGSRKQPPVVGLSVRRAYQPPLLSPRRTLAASALLESLGNVSLMERPLSAVSLMSAVKSGLRARRRQDRNPDHAGGSAGRRGTAAPVHRARTGGIGHARPGDALSRRQPSAG